LALAMLAPSARQRAPGGETRGTPSRQCPVAKPAARRRGSARWRNPQRAVAAVPGGETRGAPSRQCPAAKPVRELLLYRTAIFCHYFTLS
jgi:hypothetical protein